MTTKFERPIELSMFNTYVQNLRNTIYVSVDNKINDPAFESCIENVKNTGIPYAHKLVESIVRKFS